MASVTEGLASVSGNKGVGNGPPGIPDETLVKHSVTVLVFSTVDVIKAVIVWP